MKKIEVKDVSGLRNDLFAGQGNGIVSINGRNYKSRNKVFYIAGLGVDLTTNQGQLVLQKTQKELGLTNFDGTDKLSAGRMIEVSGIRILFDTTAGVTPKTALWKSEAPAAFKNGEIIISQGGSGNLLEYPIGPLAKYSSSLAAEDEFRQIIPFLIREQISFSILMQLAGNTAVDQAFRLELDCIEYVEVSAS